MIAWEPEELIRFNKISQTLLDGSGLNSFKKRMRGFGDIKIWERI